MIMLERCLESYRLMKLFEMERVTRFCGWAIPCADSC